MYTLYAISSLEWCLTAYFFHRTLVRPIPEGTFLKIVKKNSCKWRIPFLSASKHRVSSLVIEVLIILSDFSSTVASKSFNCFKRNDEKIGNCRQG